MIVITGAAGFIGSNILSRLNYEGYRDIVLVDDFSDEGKYPNFKGKAYSKTVDRVNLFKWIDQNQMLIQFVIHMGAHAATDDALNLDYSQKLWNKCVEYGLPFIYASSAATYGNGKQGFSDEHESLATLKPESTFGKTKHAFDSWALQQERKPYFWAGLKLFSVYGPNEYHKGELASAVYRSYNQIRESGHIKLYRATNPELPNGEQTRDFTHVRDVAEVVLFFLELRKHSGIYNIGTGTARSFNQMAHSIYDALGIQPNIVYGAIPEYLRTGYQEHTCANITKLRSIGYAQNFTNLEEGIKDYVQHFLFYGKHE